MKMNQKPQCAFYLSMAPSMKQYVQKALPSLPLKIFSTALSSSNITPGTQVLAIFVDSKITEDVINKMPNLRLITALSTGFDNIDLDATKKRHIAVCNVPAYGEVTVAEHAIALLLAMVKNIPASVECVKKGVFNCLGLQGYDLQGKTVGVIGTGNIGKNFIRLLRGFGVKILAYDAKKNIDLQKEMNFAYVSFEKLITQSDIISLHVPLIPQTQHLINKDVFSKMKKGSFLINTSRGAVIDSIALAAAIKKEKLRGVALGVLEGEQYIKGLCKPENARAKKLCEANNFLIQHPHVLITPHNAFNTFEAVQRIFDTSIKNIKNFATGKNLKNRVV